RAGGAPLEGAGGELAIPLGPVPLAGGDEGGSDVGGPRAEIAGILGQDVEPAVGHEDEELLPAGAAAAVEQEGDLVAVGAGIKRRRRLPPEPHVDLTGIEDFTTTKGQRQEGRDAAAAARVVD